MRELNRFEIYFPSEMTGLGNGLNVGSFCEDFSYPFGVEESLLKGENAAREEDPRLSFYIVFNIS